jgi:hypothetical protein
MAQNPTGWNVLSLGLSIGASAAAIIGALWGLWLLGRRWWDRSFGKRHAQARILDHLACSVSMTYIESLLGAPLFITHPHGDESEERIYRLPGAWVAIQPKSIGIQSFSITITDPKMYYDISEMTRGVLPVKLGKDSFAHVKPEYHDSESLWFGARVAGYVRHYFLGNSSGYLHYWLSFNGVGAGRFTTGVQPYQSGIYGNYGDRPPDPAAITANTFTASSGTVEDEKGRELFGPHPDTLRLMWAARKTWQ